MPAAHKPVFVAPLAQRDVDEAAAHYQDEAGEEVALRFLLAVGDALALLSRNPGIGSPRYATELKMPGVRCWPLRPWPQLVFYVERERTVDVFRVLHGARDVPATLGEAKPGAPP